LNTGWVGYGEVKNATPDVDFNFDVYVVMNSIRRETDPTNGREKHSPQAATLHQSGIGFNTINPLLASGK
jgi:hypothetical protein